MYEHSYLNPAAFQPKPEMVQTGPIGALQYGAQMDDYAKIMQVQHFLQELGANQAQQKHAEFMQQAPLRQLEAQGKEETLRGQMPYLRQAAGVQQQHQMAGQNFDINTKFSKGAEDDFFVQLRNRSDEQTWTRFQRELTSGAQLAQQAIDVQKTSGPLAAQAYVQQRREQLMRAGINLPDMSNPEMWPRMVETGKNAFEHLRAMERTNAEIAGREKVANIQAAAVRDAADSRASPERNTNPDQESVRISRLIASGDATDQEKSWLSGHLERKWADIVKGPEYIVDALRAMNPETKEGKAAAERLRAAKASFMSMYGVGQRPPVGAPTHPQAGRAGPAAQPRVIDFGDLGRQR